MRDLVAKGVNRHGGKEGVAAQFAGFYRARFLALATNLPAMPISSR